MRRSRASSVARAGSNRRATQGRPDGHPCVAFKCRLEARAGERRRRWTGTACFDHTPAVGTEPEIDEICDIVQRHLPGPAYHAYLFGSRARHEARLMSDWDIGIVGPLPVRGAVLEAIREDLEALRTLHRFDVVDLKNVSPEMQASALASAVQLL